MIEVGVYFMLCLIIKFANDDIKVRGSDASGVVGGAGEEKAGVALENYPLFCMFFDFLYYSTVFFSHWAEDQTSKVFSYEYVNSFF